MRCAELQHKEEHTCILVSFPGIKMNAPHTVQHRKKGRKGVTLCVQLNGQGKLHDFYFARDSAIPQIQFIAKKKGQQVLHQAVNWKHSAQTMEARQELEYIITDELSIVRKETKTTYEYVLLYKEKEQAGRRKSKRRKLEKIKVTEHVLFIVPKNEKQEKSQNKRQVTLMSAARNSMLKNSKNAQFPYTAKDKRAGAAVRIQKMRAFEEVALHTAVSSRFLGPGDQLLPLPRAEPCA
jgi:hypothetical protein